MIQTTNTRQRTIECTREEKKHDTNKIIPKIISINTRITITKTLFFFFLHFSHCALSKCKIVINPVKSEQTATGTLGLKHKGDSTRERNKDGKISTNDQTGQADYGLDDIDIALAEIKSSKAQDKLVITPKQVSGLTDGSKDEAQLIAKKIFNENKNITKAKNDFVESIKKSMQSKCKRINNTIIQNLTNDITAKYIEKIKIMYEIKKSKNSQNIFDNLKNNETLYYFLEMDPRDFLHNNESRNRFNNAHKVYGQFHLISQHKQHFQNELEKAEYISCDYRYKIENNYLKRADMEPYYITLSKRVKLCQTDDFILHFIEKLEKLTNYGILELVDIL